MIKDRGMKKWQGFMMPEQTAMLKKLYVDLERVEKPEVDEQESAQINGSLCTASEYNLPVIITLWEDGFFSEIEGTIHYIDDNNRRVLFADISGNSHRIAFDNIVGVEYKN